MKDTRIFLLRHAKYSTHTKDLNPGLSEVGVKQSEKLGDIINNITSGDGSKITIWTSPAKRAKETARIIQKKLFVSDDNSVIRNKLWSDGSHKEDIPWLKKEIEGFKETSILIIISHLEYVKYTPLYLGFDINYIGYAEGVCIYNGKCELI